MTQSPEERFMKIFDIPVHCGECIECYEANSTPVPFCEKLQHPKITDAMVIELAEVLMKVFGIKFYYNHNLYYGFTSVLESSSRPFYNKVNSFREVVISTAACLGEFPPLKEKIHPYIQELFKEYLS